MGKVRLPVSDTHFERDSDTYQYRSYAKAISLIPKIKRIVALDIGAHVGYWSRAMQKDFKRVFSFEPSSENYKYLLKNCKKSVCYNVAIGNSSGYCGLSERGFGSKNSGSYYTVSGDLVEVKTIDSFSFKKASYIKIDVQGDERKVISGAINTIKRCKPVMSIECTYKGSLDTELISFITRELKYKLLDISSKDYIFIPDDYIFPKNFNYDLDKKGKRELVKKYETLSEFMFFEFDFNSLKFIV